MRKVAIFSALLVVGLAASQLADALPSTMIRLTPTVCLAFIMIHVGYEFDIDTRRPRTYAWDYAVAFTAASFPWVFVALYFVFVLAPAELWWHPDLWKETLLQARFAAPTSAGVLFSMLAAAGLSATWVFQKARILAIFDDLDTILLMVPLKMALVGSRWQLWVVVAFIATLLAVAWRYLHRVAVPVTWPWVIGYASAVLMARLALPDAWTLAGHVLAVTFLANLGKMFPVFCYRREATLRERVAVAIGMWPRGEVGAGVLLVSMSYGIAGPGLAVAVLSLATNLLLTVLFIAVVRHLVRTDARVAPGS